MLCMIDPDQLPVHDEKSGRVHVLIDTPAGSRNKYKYDRTLGTFRLSRVLPAGSEFPHDFGSIPQTRAADGDALDVLVIGLAPSFPGCVVTARLIGVLHAEQTEGGRRIRNDRLLAVAETEVNEASVTELEQLGEDTLRDIEHFFESYNRRQGREFRMTGRDGRRAAERLLEEAVRSFRSEQGGSG
jgi:inorganic pyrophosphatase